MKYLIALLLGMFPFLLPAQIPGNNFHFNFKAGYIQSSIDGIQATLIPSEFSDSTFKTQIINRNGIVGEVSFGLKFKPAWIAVEGEVGFSQKGGNFKYKDIKSLEYEMAFNYNYLNLGGNIKLYPLGYMFHNIYEEDNQTFFPGGISLILGFHLGTNISSSNIEYTSNKPYLGPDMVIKQNLKNVLKGRSDFSISFGIGSEFLLWNEDSIILEAKIKVGKKDVIETLSNGYGFIENDNLTKSFQIVLGYSLGFDAFD